MGKNEKYSKMIKKDNFQCFDCETGFLEKQLKDYKTTDGKGELLVVPNVPHYICDKCGESCLDSEASSMIEKARKKTGVKYKNPRLIKEIQLKKPLPQSGETDCPQCNSLKSVKRHNSQWSCYKCGFCEIYDPENQENPQTR